MPFILYKTKKLVPAGTFTGTAGQAAKKAAIRSRKRTFGLRKTGKDRIRIYKSRVMKYTPPKVVDFDGTKVRFSKHATTTFLGAYDPQTAKQFL